MHFHICFKKNIKMLNQKLINSEIIFCCELYIEIKNIHSENILIYC